MKCLLPSALAMLSLSVLMSLNAAAEDIPEFSRYPALKTVETCKTPDFSTFFRAQEGKKQILRDNPERSKPNYGGKYLLLKQELLLETLWLIVDCESGKFYREYLKGKIEFNPKSLLVVVSNPKSDQKAENQVWSGEEWSRVDPEVPGKPVAVVKSAAPAPVATAASASLKSLDTQYQTLFEKYPVVPEKTCMELDFDSYFRAQSSKNNLKQLNPDRTKPNFAGKYLLLKNDVLFERYWMIADCTTGKFFPEIMKGNLEFRPDSYLVLMKLSSEYARVSLWREQRFIEILNPVRTGKQVVENKVYDLDAKDLMSLVASGRENKVSFEDLKCAGQNCTIRIYPSKEPKPLSPQQAIVAETVLHKWGGEFRDGANVTVSIEEGKCTKQKNNPVCEITLSR